MKLALGTALSIGLMHDDNLPPMPVGRIAMAGGVAWLQWKAQFLISALQIALLHYLQKLGLIAPGTHHFDGFQGFLIDSLNDAWSALLLLRRLAKMV